MPFGRQASGRLDRPAAASAIRPRHADGVANEDEEWAPPGTTEDESLRPQGPGAFRSQPEAGGTGAGRCVGVGEEISDHAPFPVPREGGREQALGGGLEEQQVPAVGVAQEPSPSPEGLVIRHGFDRRVVQPGRDRLARELALGTVELDGGPSVDDVMRPDRLEDAGRQVIG